MGGICSGRTKYGGKRMTADCRSLDVRRLQREGLLKLGGSFSRAWGVGTESEASIRIRPDTGKLTLSYLLKGDGCVTRPMEYAVHLDWTHCTLGGQRAWFLCPAGGCGRRVAVLYFGRSGRFACRHCNRLVYACQREVPYERTMRRADKIRRRLGWVAGILNPDGGKPKGMHWRTFERLKSRQDWFADSALIGMSNRLEVLEHFVTGLISQRVTED